MDGGWVLTAHPVVGRFELTLTEIPTGSTEPRQVLPDVPAEFRKGVDVYHFTCVGDTLIGVGRKQRQGPIVFRWDLRSGKLLRTTPIRVRENGFEVSADGRRLATWQGGLKVWDTETGAEAVSLDGAPSSAVTGPVLVRREAPGQHRGRRMRDRDRDGLGTRPGTVSAG